MLRDLQVSTRRGGGAQAAPRFEPEPNRPDRAPTRTRQVPHACPALVARKPWHFLALRVVEIRISFNSRNSTPETLGILTGSTRGLFQANRCRQARENLFIWRHLPGVFARSSKSFRHFLPFQSPYTVGGKIASVGGLKLLWVVVTKRPPKATKEQDMPAIRIYLTRDEFGIHRKVTGRRRYGYSQAGTDCSRSVLDSILLADNGSGAMKAPPILLPLADVGSLALKTFAAVGGWQAGVSVRDQKIFLQVLGLFGFSRFLNQ